MDTIIRAIARYWYLVIVFAIALSGLGVNVVGGGSAIITGIVTNVWYLMWHIVAIFRPLAIAIILLLFIYSVFRLNVRRLVMLMIALVFLGMSYAFAATTPESLLGAVAPTTPVPAASAVEPIVITGVVRSVATGADGVDHKVPMKGVPIHLKTTNSLYHTDAEGRFSMLVRAIPSDVSFTVGSGEFRLKEVPAGEITVLYDYRNGLIYTDDPAVDSSDYKVLVAPQNVVKKTWLLNIQSPGQAIFLGLGVIYLSALLGTLTYHQAHKASYKKQS